MNKSKQENELELSDELKEYEPDYDLIKPSKKPIWVTKPVPGKKGNIDIIKNPDLKLDKNGAVIDD
ncbi:MAG: hypothetical protein GY714_21010 [Desulfobacterales bacterium]|nr:hypothetical protein [Desulfobacterales bacterium]